MMDMSDFRGNLIDDLERGKAALSLVDRLAGFVRALRDDGFGVSCDVVSRGAARVAVTLRVDCPAGVVAGPSELEIVEPARARPAPLPPEPASHPLPPLGKRKPASEPATERRAADNDEDARIVEMRVDGQSIDKIAKELRRSKSFIHGRIEGPLAARIAALSDLPRHNLPYDDAEDAQIVEMAAGGMTPIEIAGEVGRTQAAVAYRCRNVLADRLASASITRRAAKVAAKKAREGIFGRDVPDAPCTPAAQLDAPEPVQPQPEPVPSSAAKADLPAPVSQAAPVPVAAVSPVAGMRAEDMTGQLVRAHLCWLYGESPDADQMQGDLELVELLLTTGSAAQVAQEFDWPKEQVLARWQELRGCQGVTLDLQRYMLDVLREMLREVAA